MINISKKSILTLVIFILVAVLLWRMDIHNEKNVGSGKILATQDEDQPESSAFSEAVAADSLEEPANQSKEPSLENFAKKDFRGSDFKMGEILDENLAYTRYYITYKSDGNLVSGIMNVPNGKGPFPVLVLNHGYINPAVYTNGRGLKREQDYLARRGYVVVHPDYRNHAQSDKVFKDEEDEFFGYDEDVINAVLALKDLQPDFADIERIGMLGHSLGGGVALRVAVTRPDLAGAFVLFAPVSSDAWDNYMRWHRDTDKEGKLTEKYGTKESNPDFWKSVSSVKYFGRIQAPVLIHHGDADESCPLEWSEKTVGALKKAGKDVELKTYPGQPHEFTTAWLRVMEQTAEFFDKNV